MSPLVSMLPDAKRSVGFPSLLVKHVCISFIVKPMNGHYHPDDEEDDNHEMIGLLSQSDNVVPSTDPQKKKPRKKRCADMKPLEVMHMSARRRFATKNSTMACQVGAVVACVSVLAGVWVWSGRTVKKNTSILRWNTLNLGDVQHRCLDVSDLIACMSMILLCSLTCALTLNVWSFKDIEQLRLSQSLGSSTSNWSQNVARRS